MESTGPPSGLRNSRMVRAAMLVAFLLVAAGAAIYLTQGGRATSATTKTTIVTSTMPWMLNPAEVETTDYSSFQLIPGLGVGATQFEGDSDHLYNYTMDAEMATINMTLGASVIAPPTLYDGLLLVDLSDMSGAGMSQYSGGVAAINIQTGELVWKTTVPNQMMAQPLTYDGLVIIGLGNKDFQNSTTIFKVRGTGTNYVAALNASTGSLVWTYPTDGEDMPTPVISDGLVVEANGDGSVYALNPLTGKDVWNVNLPTGSFVSMSSPAVSGSSIYFGAAESYVFYSVDIATGQISWSTKTLAAGGLDDCSPAVWNNIVVSGYTAPGTGGEMQPVLVGFNATSGAILWQLKENPGPKPPAIQVPPITIGDGIAYSDPTESGTLYAVNASSGALLWSFKTGPDASNANIFDG